MTGKHARPIENSDAAAHERARRRMDLVDALSPELRSCVHEHGLTVVKAFLDCGVRNARHINHLIGTVRAGSQEIGKRVEKISISNGISPDLFATVPVEPTLEMIDAGLRTTASFLEIKGTALTVNREKMRRRYRAMVMFCRAAR